MKTAKPQQKEPEPVVKQKPFRELAHLFGRDDAHFDQFERAKRMREAGGWPFLV